MASFSTLSLPLLLLVLLALLFVSTPSFARADDDSSDPSDDIDVSDDDGVEVETDYDADYTDPSASAGSDVQYNFMSHPDVSTAIYFPSHPAKNFEVGEEVVALVGFSNTGTKTFNVTYTGANLLSPEDGNFYIQNFSVIAVSQLVDPGQEMTFEYRFRPAEQLEAAEYRLAGWVLYNSTEKEGGMFFNTYFNQTVEIKEKNKGLLSDLGRLLTIVLLLAGLGAGGYFGVQAATGGGKKKKRRTYNPEDKKPAPEWEVTAYKPASKQKAFGQKKRSQKKEKEVTVTQTTQVTEQTSEE